MWLYIEEGAAFIFPDKWEEFIKPIPKAERGDILSAYHRRCVTNQVLHTTMSDSLIPRLILSCANTKIKRFSEEEEKEPG